MNADRKVVLAVVLLLGFIAAGGMAGLVYLIALDKPAEALAIIAGPTGGALGGLGAMLASTRSASEGAMSPDQVAALIQAQLTASLQALGAAPGPSPEPVAVEVVNTAEAPVPTTTEPVPEPDDDAFPGPELAR